MFACGGRDAQAQVCFQIESAFEKFTGDPVLLNTSFNVLGEPIVNHPRAAVLFFSDTGFDVLALGNFVLEKKG